MFSIPEISLTQTEIDIVHEKLSDPTIKKYLTSIIRPLVVELVSESIPNREKGQTDIDFFKTCERMRGAIDAFETLLRIGETS